jgi:poly-gamma-glutamate capsule biosynthesis protein CapA/YwtB (metallophosphatase superfamily)
VDVHLSLMMRTVLVALCLLMGVIVAPAPTTAQADESISLAAVGDMMLARSIGAALVRNPLDSPFAAVADILRDADIAVGNLECAIATTGIPARKAFTFRAPPQAVSALAGAGFDVLSLANNHSLDYGAAALVQTTGSLDLADIHHVGAGLNEEIAYHPQLLTVKGVRLAFLAYVDAPPEGRFNKTLWAARGIKPGVAWADPERIRADVSAAKLDADVVIVLLHSGTEGSRTPNRIQRAAAHAAIDAGAALVIGSHPHVLQGVEYYGKGVIAYSLGNFVFDGFRNNDSAILLVTLRREGVRELKWTPVVIRKGRPQVATDTQAALIQRRIESMTALLNR